MAKSPEHMDRSARLPSKGQKAGKPPITENPAFPWVVALWFAALLGVGSLIVPVALLERVSTASGLARLLPMAAPPLGFTAQSLVALVGTLAGSLLGFVLARKIASPKTGDATARKVLNAAEEIGDLSLADDHDALPAPTANGRRRALAIEEEEGPSDFLKVSPVPAVREPGAKPASHETPGEAMDEQPGKASQLGTTCSTPEQSEEPRQVFQPDPDSSAAGDEPLELDAAHALDTEPAVGQQPAAQEPAPDDLAQPQRPVIGVHCTPPVEAAATAEEPLAFSPPSMAGENRENDQGEEQHFIAEATFAPDHEAGQESEETVSDKQIFEAPAAPQAQAEDETAFAAPADNRLHAEQEDSETGEGETSEGETGEGLVQLVQRLGATLEKHREWAAQRAAETALREKAEADGAQPAQAQTDAADIAKSAPAAPIPEQFDPAAPDDAAQAIAAYFGVPAAQPAPAAVAEAEASEAPSFAAPSIGEEEPVQRYAALGGALGAIDLDEEDEDSEDDIADLAASFTLPPMRERHTDAAPRPAFDQPPATTSEGTQEPAAPEPENGGETADFPANPFKRKGVEFVRIEEPEPEPGSAEPAVLFPNQDHRKATAPAPAPAARAFDPPVGEGEAAAARAERPQPSNDDNERALREALLNLQRMSK